MGIRGFEHRLERLVEGTFARMFKSGLRPVELGRRLVREMDTRRSVGVSGDTVAPNDFVFELSQDDADRFAAMQESLRRELADTAREHARDSSYSFVGPVDVRFEVADRLRAGNFRLQARMSEGSGGRAPGSLVLPDGTRIVLGEAVVTVGRLEDSTLVIEDPNVSRNHAEVRPHGTGFVVVDLQSTNGSVVNGQRIAERTLQDGDVIEFGNVAIRFEAS